MTPSDLVQSHDTAVLDDASATGEVVGRAEHAVMSRHSTCNDSAVMEADNLASASVQEAEDAENSAADLEAVGQSRSYSFAHAWVGRCVAEAEAQAQAHDNHLAADCGMDSLLAEMAVVHSSSRHRDQLLAEVEPDSVAVLAHPTAFVQAEMDQSLTVQTFDQNQPNRD